MFLNLFSTFKGRYSINELEKIITGFKKENTEQVNIISEQASLIEELKAKLVQIGQNIYIDKMLELGKLY